LDDTLRLLVLTFAELMVTNASTRIEDVQRRPVVVVIGAPDGVLAVDGDWIADLHLTHRATNVLDVVFERDVVPLRLMIVMASRSNRLTPISLNA
jgi:hypothetical protein